MVKTLSELSAIPEFQAMSYGEQQQVKQEFFKRVVTTDPMFKQLSQDEQNQTYFRIMDTAPAFKDLGGISLTPEERQAMNNGTFQKTSELDNYKKAIWLHDRALAGDQEAVKQIDLFAAQNAALNESMIGQVAMGAMGAMEHFSDGTGPSPLAQDRETLNKMTDYLKNGLSQDDAEAMGNYQNAASFGTMVAESIALSAFGGEVLKGAGLFTKGIYQTMKEGLETGMIPGLARNIALATVPRGAQAVGEGITQVVRGLPTMINDGQIQGNKAILTNMAENFGTGVVLDMGLYYAGKAFYHAGKPFLNQFRKLDLNNEEDIATAVKGAEALDPDNFPKLINAIAMGKIDESSLNLFPEASRADVVDRINKTFTNLTAKSVDLNSPEGFSKYAAANLHDVSFENGKIQLYQFDHPDPVFEATSYREAADYLSNYTRTTDFTKWSDDLMQAMRGKVPEANLNIVATSKVTADKLSSSSLVSSMQPTATGKIDSKNIKVTTENLIKRTGATGMPPLEVERVPTMAAFNDKIKNFSSGKIYVPDVIRNADEMAQFSNYYNFKLTKLTEALQGDVSKLPAYDQISKWMTSPDTFNPVALQSFVQKLGGDLKIAGSTYELKLPGNAPQIFTNSREAERAIADFRVKTIPVNEVEVQEQLARSGKKLQLVEDPNTSTPENPITMWQVRGEGGSIEHSEGSLEQLVTKHPQYMPRLPSYMAPKLSFVGKGNKVRIVGDMMIGNERDIRIALDGYASDTDKIISHIEHAITDDKFGDLSGDIVANSKFSYSLEVPELGFVKKFANPTEAKRYLEKDLRSFDSLERLANERGIRLDSTKAGELLAVDSTGKSVLLKNNEQFKKLIASYPDPHGASEFIGSNNSFFTEDMAEQAHQMAEKDMKKLFIDQEKYHTESRQIAVDRDAWLTPMSDSIQAIDKVAGNTALPQEVLDEIAKTNPVLAQRLKGFTLTKFQVGAMSGMRLSSAEIRKSEVIMDKFLRIGKRQLNKAERTATSKLLEVPEEKWAIAAKNLNYTLDKDHIQVLKNAKSFLKWYGQYFGVDLEKMYTNYAPKIRAYLNEIKVSPQLQEQFVAQNKQAIIHRLFGASPEELRTVEFFAKHGRIESFLGEADNKDIVRSLKYYVSHGMNEKYMQPIIADAQKWFEHLKDVKTLTPNQTEIIGSWMKGLSGESLTGGDAIIANLSKSITANLGKWMQKQSNKFTPTSKVGRAFESMADQLYSKGALEMANSAVTYATLGARPLRGLQNMMQFNNTIAIYGRYADDAMEGMMSGSVFDIKRANDLVQRYLNNGIIEDKVFSSGLNQPQVREGIFEMSMRNQKNSELWTRAATAYAIEKNFTDVFPFYASGKISAQKFLKESNIEFLDDGMQKEIMGLIQEGKPEAAMHLYQMRGVNILMGDYDAANYPLSFKGTAGKAFGRFGVYPVNQIALYKRIATRGSTSSKLLHALRFGVVTTATYEAFKMAGVNYTGFLAWDPFSFSGGPLFKLGQDILNSKPLTPGEVDLSTKLSRKEALAGWKLLVPFSSQGTKLIQAYESANNGEIHKALVEAMSGSYAPDSLLTPMLQ